jgi:dynein heavy chain
MHKTGKPIGGGQIEPPWSLDDVVYSTTVKEKDQEQIKEGRDKDVEGVYVRELILEGARWWKNSLESSRPREMFAPLPLLHVTAINKKKSGDDKSVYSCPVYKYAKRTDKYLIFRVNLNSETDPPSKWKLKGVALLCAKE